MDSDETRTKYNISQENDSEITKLQTQLSKLEENLVTLATENIRLKKVQIDYTAKCNENEKLKIDLESEKKNNKQANHSAVYNDNANLKVQLKELKKNLSTLRTDKEVLTCKLADSTAENKILKDKITTFSESSGNYLAICDENENLKAHFNNLSTTLNVETEKLKKVQIDYTAKCKENEKLKTHLENEKLKNNKQASYSVVCNDCANLKVQLKELRKHLSMLRTDKEILISKFADSDTIHNENERLKNKLKELEDKEKSKYDQSTTEKIKNGEIFKFQRKPNELDEVQDKKEEYEKEIKNLNNLLQQREKEKQDLIEKIISLKKEASQYHYALGTATNYRIGDNDKNHSVHLKEDIEELQTKLKNYVTTLKGDFDIDFNAVNDLMEKYNIKAKVTPKNPNKPLIRAVLQYHILKKIINYKNDYFKKNSSTGNEIHLEAEIVSKAKDLEGLLARFSETRDGNDTITQTASIKIRQEVNIALGNRGFSKILCENNTSTDHVFIIFNKNELNKEMNKYRIIKDETKREYAEKLASDLIREFVRIVQFRLKVQEPSAQMRWVKVDANIDQSIMEGSWDKDYIDNLLVEVCSFPMIGRDLDNVEKRKIYTHAQVFTKRKKLLGNVTKGLNNIWPKKNKGNLEPVSDDEE